jgi:hypothetical protein
MVVEGAALLAAAIRAAIHAKAPRRTVQAVAAAVTGVLVRPTAAAARDVDATGPAGTTVEEIRAQRGAQRQRKKLRRRLATAKAAAAAPAPGAEVLQRQAVRAEALGVESVVVGGMAHGLRDSKRRKKGGNASRHSGGASDGDGMAGLDVAVLQRKAVRAATSLDIADSEGLDDYWADEGMPQAEAATTATVRTDVLETEADSTGLAEGALRRKRVLKLHAIQESLLAKISAEGDDPHIGLASHHATACRAKLRLYDGLLGMDDFGLSGIGWPPPGL